MSKRFSRAIVRRIPLSAGRFALRQRRHDAPGRRRARCRARPSVPEVHGLRPPTRSRRSRYLRGRYRPARWAESAPDRIVPPGRPAASAARSTSSRCAPAPRRRTFRRRQASAIRPSLQCRRSGRRRSPSTSGRYSSIMTFAGACVVSRTARPDRARRRVVRVVGVAAHGCAVGHRHATPAPLHPSDRAISRYSARHSNSIPPPPWALRAHDVSRLDVDESVGTVAGEATLADRRGAHRLAEHRLHRVAPHRGHGRVARRHRHSSQPW